MKGSLAFRRPSPAMAVALTALFLGFVGTGYAAFSLPAHSVGTKQLKSGAVTTSKLRDGAVTAAKLNVTGVTVPNALQAISANTAGSATSASTASNAANAIHASTADSATNANTADHAKSADSLTTLASGKSESGAFSAGGGYDPCTSGCGWIGAGITFARPLATAIPDSHIIDVKGTSATHCSGPGHADPGYLCLYDTVYYDVNSGYGYSDDPGMFSSPSPGVVLYWPVGAAGVPYSGGEYTVTAS